MGDCDSISPAARRGVQAGATAGSTTRKRWGRRSAPTRPMGEGPTGPEPEQAPSAAKPRTQRSRRSFFQAHSAGSAKQKEKQPAQRVRGSGRVGAERLPRRGIRAGGRGAAAPPSVSAIARTPPGGGSAGSASLDPQPVCCRQCSVHRSFSS